MRFEDFLRVIPADPRGKRQPAHRQLFYQQFLQYLLYFYTSVIKNVVEILCMSAGLKWTILQYLLVLSLLNHTLLNPPVKHTVSHILTNITTHHVSISYSHLKPDQQNKFSPA